MPPRGTGQDGIADPRGSAPGALAAGAEKDGWHDGCCGRMDEKPTSGSAWAVRGPSTGGGPLLTNQQFAHPATLTQGESCETIARGLSDWNYQHRSIAGRNFMHLAGKALP